MGGPSQIRELLEENVSLKAENERILADNRLLMVKLNDEHTARQNAETENAKLKGAVKFFCEFAKSFGMDSLICAMLGMVVDE